MKTILAAILSLTLVGAALAQCPGGICFLPHRPAVAAVNVQVQAARPLRSVLVRPWRGGGSYGGFHQHRVSYGSAGGYGGVSYGSAGGVTYNSAGGGYIVETTRYGGGCGCPDCTCGPNCNCGTVPQKIAERAPLK